jgi:Tfp pilus assembly protein PilN
MRSLTLDYQVTGDRSAWAGWALLAVAIVFSAEVVWSYFSTRTQLRAREAELASLSQQLPASIHSRTIIDPKELERRVLFANSIINKLAVPWRTLFVALETARIDEVSLLSIEPDANAGTLTLTGEAKDFAGLLTYIARLEANKTLTGISLLKHEIKLTDPQRPVYFTISALWKSKP